MPRKLRLEYERWFESGARQAVTAGAATRAVSLEQLASVFAATRPTLALAAIGSIAGRMAGWTGQCRRVSAIGAKHGTTQGTGNQPRELGMEESAPGLVLGAKGFTGGDVGADRSEKRPAALRGGVEGIGRAEGAAVNGGDVEEGGLDGGGFNASAERGSEKGAFGGTIAGRDTDELVVDRKAIGDGVLADGVECRWAGSFNEEKLNLAASQYTISHL